MDPLFVFTDEESEEESWHLTFSEKDEPNIEEGSVSCPAEEETENDISQRLEMVMLKRSRCQEWVSSQISHSSKEHHFEQNSDEKEDNLLGDISDESSDNTQVILKKRRSNDPLYLELRCEWKNCNFCTSCIGNEFQSHVSSHIPELEIDIKEDESEVYLCLWDCCDFETDNPSEAKRHVNYHSYHTRLKAGAAKLNISWDFPACKLLDCTRNCLPELLTSFYCEWTKCDYKCDNFEYFLIHVHKHISDTDFADKRPVSCSWKGCMMILGNYSLYKVHMRKHTDEKTAGCPTCGAMFATNTKYKDHCIRRLPPNDESCRCKYCWRYFANIRLLRDHMRYHINVHRCSFCEMTCPTPSRLTSHIQFRHLNERHFKCSICSFTCKTIDDYNSHLYKHDPEEQFQCNGNKCKFKCRSKVTVKNHYQKVHKLEPPSIYRCHLCDKRYNRGGHLTSHLQKVHKIVRPPGHSRFRYMRDANGHFKLQVERYESVETQSNQSSQIKINYDEKLKYVVVPQEVSEQCTSYRVEVENKENMENDEEQILISIEEIDEMGTIISRSTVKQIPDNNIPMYSRVIAVCDTKSP